MFKAVANSTIRRKMLSTDSFKRRVTNSFSSNLAKCNCCKIFSYNRCLISYEIVLLKTAPSIIHINYDKSIMYSIIVECIFHVGKMSDSVYIDGGSNPGILNPHCSS